MASPKILVVGASGLVGRKLVAYLGGAAIGTYCCSPRPGMLPFDLAADDPDDLLDAAGEAVTHMVILGAQSNIDACARDPQKTFDINVHGIGRLIDRATARGIIPVFASSDAVYGDIEGLADEALPPQPINEYGCQKLALERHMQTLPGSWLILRFAKILDPVDLAPAGILGPWLASLQSGALIRCVDDQRLTPVAIDDAVQAVVALILRGASGVFNIGGPESLGRLDILRQLESSMAVLAPVVSNIQTCRTEDLNLLAPRPRNCSLDIAKIGKTIGFVPQFPAQICWQAVVSYLSKR